MVRRLQNMVYNASVFERHDSYYAYTCRRRHFLDAGFEQQLLMQNNQIMDYALVIDLYSYKFGIQQSMYSYSCGCGIV